MVAAVYLSGVTSRFLTPYRSRHTRWKYAALTERRGISSCWMLAVYSQLYGRFRSGSIFVPAPPVNPVLAPSSLSCAFRSLLLSVHERRFELRLIELPVKVKPMPSFFTYWLALALVAVRPLPNRS